MKPVLADRLARYVTTHRASYDHIATFTGGNYGDVLRAARDVTGLDFPVFPTAKGPRVVRLGDSVPRTYWEKHWIQLCLQIIAWLDPARQAQARARLEALDVEYEPGAP